LKLNQELRTILQFEEYKQRQKKAQQQRDALAQQVHDSSSSSLMYSMIMYKPS
jgi:hypothetical protein